MVKGLFASVAALSLAAVPAISMAQEGQRASQPSDELSNLGGGNFVPLAVILATIGGAIWIAVDDDDDDPVSV